MKSLGRQVNGSVIALLAAVIGIAAVGARRLAARTAVMAGYVANALGMELLVLSATKQSLTLLIATSVVCCIGFSLLFLGGLTSITERAPVHHRAGTLSGVCLIAYLTQGAVAVGLGLLATATHLRLTLHVGAPVVALLSAAAAACRPRTIGVLAQPAATTQNRTSTRW
jgi:hypothetical protein